MTLLTRINALLDATTTPIVASAHCDLPCGVYDPAQAKIEAQSVKACMEKYNASSDEAFKARATFIKEERCDLVKHHLWVLWTDYFKVDHLKAYPNLHDLFWMATKSAGDAKKTNDVNVADRLLSEIDAIAQIFWATKKLMRHSSPPVVSATGAFLFSALGEFGVRRTVREQRISHECVVIDRGAAHVTRPVGTTAKPLERPIDVVQR